MTTEQIYMKLGIYTVRDTKTTFYLGMYHASGAAGGC